MRRRPSNLCAVSSLLHSVQLRTTFCALANTILVLRCRQSQFRIFCRRHPKRTAQNLTAKTQKIVAPYRSQAGRGRKAVNGLSKPVAYCRRCSVCWAIARLNIHVDFDQVGLFPKKQGQSQNPASLRLLTKYTRESASGTTSRRRTPFTHLQQFGYYPLLTVNATRDC
jgi:hypothetical protein